MEGLRKAALVLCAVLMLCTVAAAEWDSPDSFDWNTTSSSPVIQQPEQSEPSPGGAAPAVPDADNHIPDKSSSQMDDSLWGSYGTHNDRPNVEPPSEKQQELEQLIAEERLKPAEAQRFVANAFRDGALKTTGTDIDQILPPVSRFGGGNRTEKKKTIIQRLAQVF